MCVAIVSPYGKRMLDRNVILDALYANPDGAGLAYARRGRIRIIKGLWTPQAVFKALRRVPKWCPLLFHARIATAGVIDHDNCHPFDLGGAAVIHNGMLPVESCPRYSDTYHYVDKVLKPRHAAGGIFGADISDIETFVGGSNKLAFLRADGEFAIANEGHGQWINDVWYSKTWGLNLDPVDYDTWVADERNWK